MGNKAELADSYMKQGYNCAQSVLLAFLDEIPLTKEEAAKLTSSFGSGMGRLGEVCGAVSAMFMIEGFKYGPENPDPEKRKQIYNKIRELGEQFQSQHGTIICRELLAARADKNDPRHGLTCRDFVKTAAAMMEREIAANG